MILQGGANVTELLETTGPLARIILLILLMFSIGSWGVIISKTLLLKKIRKESKVFWSIFQSRKNLSEISTACETLHFTPLVPVFDAGFAILVPPGLTESGGHALRPATAASVQRGLLRASAAQLSELESRMTFLATTATVTPFIGLFGTVWGVIGSFAGLANENVTTLNAVGPGIAEALIATAFGLFAAIPAVVAYNYFVAEIRKLGGQLDDLQVEFLTLAESVSLES